jgi:general secretion pathway protein H
MGWQAAKAKTLMSEVGNKVTCIPVRSGIPLCSQMPMMPMMPMIQPLRHRSALHGFTLIELMVVITMIAIATAGVSFALRDNESTLLDREAERLAVVLEAARVQSRSTGQALAWLPQPQGFVVLPARELAGSQVSINIASISPWLTPDMNAQIISSSNLAQRSILLGAEPMIAPSSILLSLGTRRLRVVTDGLRPFTVQTVDEVVKP